MSAKHNKERNVNTMWSELGAKGGKVEQDSQGRVYNRCSNSPTEEKHTCNTQQSGAVQYGGEKNNKKQTLAFYLYPR